MKSMRLLATAVALVSFGMGAATVASAQATRTWVSGVGDDANPCSRTAPCKTFAGAISKTAPGGEIDCLDPGGFGAVTITKAMTILCRGVSNGGVLVSGTNGIVVNAGVNDAVVLQGLDFEGFGSGLSGVWFIQGASLTVEDSSIRDFNTNGINFAPATNAKLFVRTVTITNTAPTAVGTTNAGIQVRPTGAANASVTINDSEITNGLFGVVADGAATTGHIGGIVRDSNVSGNIQNGITTSIGTASNVTLMVDNVAIANNGNNGLVAGGTNAGLLVGNSSVINNGGGVHPVSGGAVVSYGNNRVNGNSGMDGAFTSTTAVK